MSALEDIKARVKGHTPGPWKVDGMDSGHSRYEMNRWITAGEANDTICDMDGLARSLNERVALNDGAADAELIAAAPKLFAALEAVEAKAAENEARAEWLYDDAETTKAYHRGKQHGFNLARQAITEALQ